jgi:hypothetical protein
LCEQTQCSHEEFGVCRSRYSLLYQGIADLLSYGSLAVDTLALDLLETFLDEDSQVDDQLVSGTLRFKVLEHDGGAEQCNCLIDDISLLI